MSSLLSSVQHTTGGSSHWIGQDKERKSIFTEKEVKLSLFRGDTNISVENLTQAIRKLLECISQFSKALGQKFNTEKSMFFL